MRVIMLAVGKIPALKIFRNNVGMGWIGSSKRGKDGTVLITNARPLHAGLCEGSADLIGWKSVEITPEMVGKKVAIFTALEVKALGKMSKEQINFINAVRQAGGISGIVRDADDARKLLG